MTRETICTNKSLSVPSAYGSNFKSISKGDWVCLKWDSGKVIHEAKWNGYKGSIIYADGIWKLRTKN